MKGFIQHITCHPSSFLDLGRQPLIPALPQHPHFRSKILFTLGSWSKCGFNLTDTVVIVSNLGGDVILSAKLLSHHCKGIRTIEENKAVCHLPTEMLLPSPSGAFGVKDALVALPSLLSPGSGLRPVGFLVREVDLTPASTFPGSALESHSTSVGGRNEYPCGICCGVRKLITVSSWTPTYNQCDKLATES